MRFLAGILAFLGCRMLLALMVPFALLWLFFGHLAAAPLMLVQDAHPIIIPADAIAYRNVVESGDLLILYRYNLPAGFDIDDEPQDWEIQGVTGVLARLILTSPPALQDRVPPRLGHALMAHYLLPGHGASWGSSDLFVRMQGNPALFENVNEQDRVIAYNRAGADSTTLVVASESRRNALCDVFRELLQGIEQADANLSAGDLVTGSQITRDGTLMAIDAFSGPVSLLPECFQVGVTGSGVAFDPPAGQLGPTREAAVEATDAWQRWEALFSSYALAVMTATVIGVAFAFAVWIAMTVWAGVVYGMGAGVIGMLIAAVWVPHFLMQIIFVSIAIGVMLASMYWWRQVPRG